MTTSGAQLDRITARIPVSSLVTGDPSRRWDCGAAGLGSRTVAPRREARLSNGHLRLSAPHDLVLSGAVFAHAQAPQLTSTQAVLERYQQALGGVDSIRQVQSETARGAFERTSMKGRATFVSQGKPFKSLFTVTRPDGSKVSSGFDGKVSWAITPEGASIDNGAPLESVRRDADLQYALHQSDYFQSLTATTKASARTWWRRRASRRTRASLLPQRVHRIDARCPSRRQPGGGERDGHHQCHGQTDRSRVVRAHAEQL
jgi:hypothetical protein